jgi:hypothetical protein
MGLAVHNAHDSIGRLPPIAATQYAAAYYSPFFFHLLPYLEQQNVYNAAAVPPSGVIFPTWQTPGQGGYQYLRQTRIKTYQCPADATLGTNIATDWFPGDSSYAANFQVFGNAGNPTSSNPADWDGRTTLVGITDGTSNTIAIAEKLAYCPGTTTNQLIGPRNYDPIGTTGTWWMRGIYGSGTPTSLGYDDSYPGDRNSAHFAGGSASDGTYWYIGVDALPTTFTIPPNNTVGHSTCDVGLASSAHGQILMVMCDGSIRSVSPGITAQTWWAACTRSGGEVLGNDW